MIFYTGFIEKANSKAYLDSLSVHEINGDGDVEVLAQALQSTIQMVSMARRIQTILITTILKREGINVV